MNKDITIDEQVGLKSEAYFKKYKKIVVTYNDGVKKTFNPYEWAIHEEKIRKMTLKGIKLYKRRKWFWSILLCKLGFHTYDLSRKEIEEIKLAGVENYITCQRCLKTMSNEKS